MAERERWRKRFIRGGGDVRTILVCCAVMGSAYWTRAWNWLFLVKVMIFRTDPYLEKIYRGEHTQVTSLLQAF